MQDHQPLSHQPPQVPLNILEPLDKSTANSTAKSTDKLLENPTIKSTAGFPKRSVKAWQMIAAIASVMVVAGGTTAWWTWRSINADPIPTLPTISPNTLQASPDATAPAPIEQTIELYWLRASETQIDLAPSQVRLNVSDRPNDILKAAFSQLLQGTTDPTLTTTIPEGTMLRSIEAKSDGVHVDLSQSFTTGGGSTSMIGRVGQIIYTATTLNPNAAVWITVEGKPLEVLGGEGLMLDQPMTRANFEENFQL